MDIKKANLLLTDKIMGFIKNKQPENEILDYKQCWENKNSELIKDIFSFTNTVHNHDCYLIYGVTDKNQSIVGVNNDSNRKDQKDIIDLLNQLPIAGDYVPPIKVNTIITPNKKQIDVLTIKNNYNVPVYLATKVKLKKDRPMDPGVIYSRVSDRDTGFNQTTNYNQTKLLWRKHFGIGLPIKKKYIRVLKNWRHWKYHDQLLPGTRPCFIYDLNPNYIIKFYDNTIDRTNVVPLSVGI